MGNHDVRLVLSDDSLTWVCCQLNGKQVYKSLWASIVGNLSSYVLQMLMSRGISFSSTLTQESLCWVYQAVRKTTTQTFKRQYELYLISEARDLGSLRNRRSSRALYPFLHLYTTSCSIVLRRYSNCKWSSSNPRHCNVAQNDQWERERERERGITTTA